MKYYIKLIFVNGLIFLLFFEIACRIIPFCKAYAIVADYESTNSFYPTLKKHMTPCKDFIFKQGNEFQYPIRINSIGLFDDEVFNPDIIGLGDSFTQGIGTPMDSTYLKVLERILNVVTLNAGIGGSNPIKDYKRLSDLFAKNITPKVVVETINTTDLFDIAMNKHGFYTDYLKSSKFLYRLIVMEDYKRFFLKKEKMYSKTHEKIYQSISAMYKLCKERNVDFVVCFQPIKDDILYGWTYDSLINKTNKLLNIPTINLMSEFKTKGGITKDNVQSLYWPIDGHFNARGYRLMGQIIADKIEEYKLLQPTN